jgi:hypothetical protein
MAPVFTSDILSDWSPEQVARKVSSDDHFASKIPLLCGWKVVFCGSIIESTILREKGEANHDTYQSPNHPVVRCPGYGLCLVLLQQQVVLHGHV